MDEAESLARLVVCDAGPLIHLDEVGCLDLLAGFAQVLVPGVVWDEVERHRPAALRFPGVSFTRTDVDAAPPPHLAAIGRLFALHLGELHALQVAARERVDLLLTDDTAARLAAGQIGIAVHGTIGILLRSIRRGQRTRDQVIATLRSLPSASTLHLKRSLLAEVIQTVEQAS
jgi:predicted nucleic acid-binding protein